MYSLAVQAGFALFLLHYCLNIIHSLYFHPLRRIPGPRLWIIFPVLRHISAVRGRLDLDIPRFHAVYGPAVRFGRDEVSFITPEAWNDIYGHGHRQLPKVLNSASNPMDIVSSNDADHTRFRKSLSHAFSARGLQAQEPFINTYVDKLIAQLKEVAKSQLPADMAKWFNLITFDIIGDLAFGEPFYGLESTQYHHWVATIFESVKLFPFVKMKDTYPTVFNLVSLFVPKRLLEAQKEQIAHAREAVKKRLHNSSAYNRGDFMDSMSRNRGKDDGLTEEEMVANANILIIAGSETTATLLAGTIYFLLRNPDTLAKVVTEVRTTMKTETDITCNSAGAKLPYMLACIQESFRLYPPVPTGLQRMTLDSMTIAGYDVPSGTKVSVHPMGASWSSLNFYAPDRFLPERWLPEVKSDPTSPFFCDKREVVQPFSVGPRNCIGRNLAFAEMRLILARLLWNFDLELCEESLSWVDQRAYTIWEKPPLMCRLFLRGAST
ncbi:probable sterigmatocystin biosynthesis P450 monooxygenase stcF [Aspergillus lentulus]|nr:probable sterigmatocystin biosynthesis P450 monooxygenase stcF [Aspergillus lentulus]GFF79149.1 probable sterigmatocystin biosynthesis P450 monooxygenase stcF [Aspergillus lentulus]